MEEAEVVSALSIADDRLSTMGDDGKRLDNELQIVCILDKDRIYLDGRVTPVIYKVFAGLFDEIVEGRANIPLDTYEKLYQRTVTNFSYELYESVDATKRLAMREIRKATQAEPIVTKDLIKATNTCAGRLEGLEFKIKTLESLSRKLRKEPQARMRDVLRYTLVSSSADLYNDYKLIMKSIKHKGYEITDIKNTWKNIGAVYKGVNTNVKTPEGYEFELQFHTEESFNLKNGELHELYEKQRILDKTKDFEEWQELEDKMYRLSTKLQTPNQIERI